MSDRRPRGRRTAGAALAALTIVFGPAPWLAPARARDLGPAPAAPPAVASDALRHADTEVDTTFAVRRGERLVLRVPEGEVRVDTGPEGVVRVVADSDPDDRRRRALPRIRRDGEQVEIRLPSERDDWRLSIPAWLPVELVGREVDVELVGLGAEVVARSGDGEIEAREVTGRLDLYAVRGDIRVADSEGELQLRTGDGEIQLERVGGRVTAETTDGDVQMRSMRAEAVQARTVDGDVTFEGRLVPGGRYELGTHDGDVVVALAPDAGARVEVTTYHGDLEPGFPVTIDGFRSGEPTVFTVGDGSAELILSSFSGDVRLVRTGGLDDSNQEKIR